MRSARGKRRALAVTHRTGRRRNSPGTDRRFDSAGSAAIGSRCVKHLYEKGIAAGSDHALVIVDLDLRAQNKGWREAPWEC